MIKLRTQAMHILLDKLDINQMRAIVTLGSGKVMPDDITKLDLIIIIGVLCKQLDWVEEEGGLSARPTETSSGKKMDNSIEPIDDCNKDPLDSNTVQQDDHNRNPETEQQSDSSNPGNRIIEAVRQMEFVENEETRSDEETGVTSEPAADEKIARHPADRNRDPLDSNTVQQDDHNLNPEIEQQSDLSNPGNKIIEAGRQMEFEEHEVTGNSEETAMTSETTADEKIARHPALTSVKTAENPRRFVCDLFGKACGSQSGLTQHLINHGSKTCNICNKEFVTTLGTTAQQKLTKHKYACTNRQPAKRYFCRGCKQEFTNKQKCERHEKRGCVKAQCETCGEKFKNYCSKGQHKCPKFHERW